MSLTKSQGPAHAGAIPATNTANAAARARTNAKRVTTGDTTTGLGRTCCNAPAYGYIEGAVSPTSTLAEAKTLDTLRFENSFAKLPPAFYERLSPTGIPNPALVAFSEDASRTIELRPGEERTDAFLAFASGNAVPRRAEPLAAAYAGHQFGSFVSQLGDGRAILLGEVVTSTGDHVEIQLKGSGRTAFSRFGDGRAVLRSTIREFLCSEAMHHLGIPTTRGLAITTSDEPVARETMETAAMLVRLAPSFVRFGSFEFFHYHGKHEELRRLADYVIGRFFPELVHSENRYAAFFREVVTRTARLMAHWQAVGFAHGVMNTDNMSILGLTLDYGPFGFLDAYEPGFICNHTDAGGRYAFDKQPTVGLWNCYALANALVSLVGQGELEAALAAYEPAYRDAYRKLFVAKLGLVAEEDGDRELMSQLMGVLTAGRYDYTRFFRALSAIEEKPSADDDALAATGAGVRSTLDLWLLDYRGRLARDGRDHAVRRTAMNAVNPKYVLRNYLAQLAIQAAEYGNFSEVTALQRVLEQPFAEQPENERYAAAPPEWAGALSVSCSS